MKTTLSAWRPVAVSCSVAGPPLRRALLVLALSFLGSALIRAQPATGTVEGTVLSATSGNFLNNARVGVEGSSLETYTDADGRYRLVDVPAGQLQVRASYTGMETTTATLRVSAGMIARQDFQLSIPRNQTTLADKDVVKLDAFVVETTALSAAATAVHEQKIAPNIKNVVVLDEIGDLGDGNIGEYLKYTPGISILGGPQTAASASIRGLPASGVVFMIDGAEVSSPSADRTYDLAASSAGSVDRIEITKVPTPDRPANAVGGTINIIGKSGFNSPRRSVKINTYGAYNSENRLEAPGFGEWLGSDPHSRSRSIQPGFDLNYTQPVNEHFAFTLNLSDLTRVYAMDYDSPGWDMIRGVLTSSSEQNVLQATERQLASTTFDWRINRENALRLNLEHVQINTPTRQNIYTVTWGAGATGGPEFTQGAAAGGDTVRQTVTWGDRTRGTTSAVLRYTHDGRLYKFDGSANYSRSWDRRKDLEHGFFRTIGNFQLSGLIVRGEALEGVYSRRSPVLTVKNRTGQPVDPYDNVNLAMGNPTSQPNEVVTDLKSTAANVSRHFALSAPTTLKVGFAVNRLRKDNTSEAKSWSFAPPAGVSRTAGSYDLVNDLLSRQSAFSGTLKLNWIDPAKYYDLFKAHPEWFTINDATTYQSRVTNSKYFRETISAAYVRGDVKYFDNKLWLVGGVRFERTDDFGAGPRNDLRATYQQDASGNLLRDAAGRLIPITTDPLATAKLRFNGRGAVSRRDYAGYYPSFNTTYYATDALVARAAYARTIGRPSLSDIIPGITVSDPGAAASAHTATIVNSGLQPWTANNYDLSFEAYGIKGAVIALGLFRKDIKNFFVDTRVPATIEMLERFGLSDEYLDYDIISTENGGTASIEGYEASWRQSLYFLPAWAKGISTFANITIARAGGPNAADFTPFAHKNINWGVSYIRRAFSFRFNVAYAYKVSGAAVAASATVPAGTHSYVAPQITQDWSFEYRFARRFSLYGGARNWNGANKRTERSGPGAQPWTRPQVYQNFGTLITLGVRSVF